MVTGRPAVCLCTADSKKAAGYSPHVLTAHAPFFLPEPERPRALAVVDACCDAIWTVVEVDIPLYTHHTQLFPHFDFLTFLLISPTPQFSAYRRGPSGLYLSPLPPASIPSLYPPPHPPESLPACPCHANCSDAVAQTAYRLFFCRWYRLPEGHPQASRASRRAVYLLSTCATARLLPRVVWEP
jgi:hypothetical protein